MSDPNIPANRLDHERAQAADPGTLPRGRAPGPSGLYNPIGHGRHVIAPDGHSTPLTRLVSYHEAMHSFLCSSTDFGNAMMLAGALVEAGHREFTPLVQHMVNLSRNTHETFATVTSLCTATGGRFDVSLFHEFPDYVQYVESFLAVFGRRARPFLASIALTSCARAAMQASVCQRIFLAPHETWAHYTIDENSSPDRRFRLIHNREVAGLAMEAIDEALMELGEPGCRLVKGLPPDIEHELVVNMSVDAQDLIAARAFEVYAAALEQAGIARPCYNSHKSDIGQAIENVNSFAGNGLRTEFQVPLGNSEDAHSVFMEFRREILVLRPHPDRAVVVDSSDAPCDSIGHFTINAEGIRYVQLVAMPLGKMQTLYSIEYGQDKLASDTGGAISTLRHRLIGRDGLPQVEFLLVSREMLSELLAAAIDVEVLAVISLSVLTDSVWQTEWLTPGQGQVTRVSVLIDTDPFELLRRRSRDGQIKWTILKLRLDRNAADYTEIFCMVASNQPELLYLMPCTTPFRQAVIEYIRHNIRNASRCDGVVDEWRGILQRVLGHLIREEYQFGIQFWD